MENMEKAYARTHLRNRCFNFSKTVTIRNDLLDADLDVVVVQHPYKESKAKEVQIRLTSQSSVRVGVDNTYVYVSMTVENHMICGNLILMGGDTIYADI